MSTIASPYGMRMVKVLGDLPFSGGMNTLPLTANQAKGFFFGDPVGLVAGQPTPLAATPTTTLSDNNPIGVFYGCEYQDPVRGFVNAQYLAPNAVSSGATKVKLKIVDYPWAVFQIQANGSVTLDKIGQNVGLAAAGLGAGSLTTGNSLVAADAATIAVAPTLALRIYDFVVNAAPSPGASSQPGDAFTDLLVVWNFGIHRYLVGTGR